MFSIGYGEVPAPYEPMLPGALGYKLAVAGRTSGSADLTPATFISQAQLSPTFAAQRTVTGPDAAQAAQLRAQLPDLDDHYVAEALCIDLRPP